MNQSNDPQNRAPDESLCSFLVGFNFLFFVGLLAVLLILPLKSTFTGSGDSHGDAHSDDAAHATSGDTETIESTSAGKKAYQICSTCHGNDGEGNQAMQAPALAGQEAWYVRRQLKKFKDGVRGTHHEDIYGIQMRPMAMTLADDAAIDAVSEYIANMPKVMPAATLGGDIEKGKAAYMMICTACHGPKAEGIKTLNGPSLQHLPDWYIVRQLKNYKEGIRGADPKDIEGMQMAPMSKTVADEQAMKDIAAFINSQATGK